MKEDKMGGKCSTSGELEGRAVGILRKSDRMVLKPIM
jgi:hypothetical protein